MPSLLESTFRRSVVLMIEHTPDGAMGVVLNKLSNVNLEELGRAQKLAVGKSRKEQPVFVGGPVESYRGFVVHDCAEMHERHEIVPGLFLSVTTDSLRPLLGSEDPTIRVILGYSGWGPGQIEKELNEGSWLFTDALKSLALHGDPKTMWDDAIRTMGLEPGRLMNTGAGGAAC